MSKSKKLSQLIIVLGSMAVLILTQTGCGKGAANGTVPMTLKFKQAH